MSYDIVVYHPDDSQKEDVVEQNLSRERAEEYIMQVIKMQPHDDKRVFYMRKKGNLLVDEVLNDLRRARS